MAKQKPEADQPAPKEAENISSLQLKLDDPPPPAETPAEPTPASEATAASAPAPEVGADEPRLIPTVAATMRQWGYEVDEDATDDDLRRHLEDVEERASKLTAAQQELEQLRQYRAQVEAERAKPATAAAAPAAEAPKPAAAAAKTADDFGIPERPQLDRFTLGVLQLAKANGLLKEGAGGLVTSEDQSLRPQLDKYNQHLVATEEYDREWGDPRKIASHILEQRLAKEREEIRKQVQDEIRGTLSQRDSQAFIDGFNKQNAEWLGSEVGTQFSEEANALMQRGFSPEEAVERAQVYVQAKTGQSPWSKEPPKVPETPAQRVANLAFRRRTTNGNDLIPTTPVSRPAAAAATRSDKGLTFDQKLSQTFSALMQEKVADRM